MAGRYLGISLLFLAVVFAPLVLDMGGRPVVPPEAERAAVPPEALAALKQGRYWRASRILRGYLAVVPDTTPETMLLAAEAEAGWGEWSRVEALLGGRDWLDSVAGGYGWSLLGRGRLERGEWAGGSDALARYLEVASHAGDRDRGLAEVRRGLALVEAGDPAAARSAFDRAAGLLPQLGDWIDVYAADAAAQAGDTAEVRRRLASKDRVLGREWGWRLVVRARLNANDLAGAQQAAEAAANGLDDAGRRADAWRSSGELRLMRGDTAAARAAFRRAIEAAPLSTGALHAGRILSGLRGATPDDHLRVGRLYVRHGNFERGIAGLRAYLASDRGSVTQRAEVRLDLGRALFRADRYDEAEGWLLSVARSAPTARLGAESMFMAGRAQYRQGRTDAARATFLRTAEQFPQERAAAEALFLVADMDHDDGRVASARELYRRAAGAWPETRQSGLALMRIGSMLILDGEFQDAAALFERYRRTQPHGKHFQQASYWAARCYFELGNRDLARERLRDVRHRDAFSYYGIRAAELLGDAFWDTPMEVSPPESAAIDAEVAAALVRLDLLRSLGRTEDADFEIERLKRHFGDRDGALYALAEALNARGHTFTGIRIGWEIFRSERVWNLRLLRIIYPFPYRELILAEAEERGLDPFLVAGLIRQESMFDAAIVSPAGAVGLMQIMPPTGRALARQVGLDRFELALLEKPELNLHLGITYLAELLDSFGRRLPAALAAYNAGPHRVVRWRRFPEWRDEELFAERIPFAETRNYVKAVQQNARLYAELYGPIATPARGD